MSRLLRRSILIIGVLAILGMGIASAFRLELNYFRNRAVIDDAAARYRVSPFLVASVIWQETRFHSEYRGKAGEIGLMQIMPMSAGEWAKSEHIANFEPATLIDPKTNILAGTWYLGRAIRRWNTQADPLPYALAEYNAGRSKALHWKRNTARSPELFTEMIEYPGTRNYVRTILKNYRSFGKPWQRW